MTLSSSVSSIASAASSAWPNLAAWIMRPSSSWSVLTVNCKQRESKHNYLKYSIFWWQWLTGAQKSNSIALPLGTLKLRCTTRKFILASPQKFHHSTVPQSVIWISLEIFSKNFTCSTAKRRTESTNIHNNCKFTSPGPLDMTFFARWLTCSFDNSSYAF